MFEVTTALLFFTILTVLFAVIDSFSKYDVTFWLFNTFEIFRIFVGATGAAGG